MTRLIRLIILLEIFLVPLFFLPFTQDFFNFNKEFLFLILTFLAILLWIGKGVKERKFSFIRTPLDIPLLVFLGIYTLASIFSENPRISFLGSAGGGANFSWFSVFFLVIFYFLVVNVFAGSFSQKDTSRSDTPRGVINPNIGYNIGYPIIILVISLFILQVLFLLNFFGYPVFPFDFSKLQSFNTLGSLSSLVIFTAVLMPVLVGILLRKEGGFLSYLILLPFLSSLLVLNLVNFRLGWIALVSGSFIFLVLIISRYSSLNFRSSWFWILIFCFILSLFSLFINIPSIIQGNLPAEVSLGRSLSREIAFKTTQENLRKLLVGSGPGTFIYDFSHFRPESFNQNPLWSIRFQRASGFLWETLATTGFLGLLSLIGLIFIFLGSGFFILLHSSSSPSLRGAKGDEAISWEERSDDPRYGSTEPVPSEARNAGIASSLPAFAPSGLRRVAPRNGNTRRGISLLLISLLSSLIALLVIFYFSTPSFPLLFLFWLALSLFTSSLIASHPDKFHSFTFSFRDSPRSSLVLSFGSVILASSVLIFLIGASRFYLAEVYGREGLKILDSLPGRNLQEAALANESDLSKAQILFEKSMNLNPNHPLWFLTSAQVALNQVLAETSKSPEGQNQDKITLYLAQAINRSKKAADLSSQDAGLWAERGRIFKEIRPWAREAQEWVITSYKKAQTLEPTNPIFLNELGHAYYLETFREKADKQGSLSQAKKYLDEALRLKQDYLPARLNLSLVLEAQGEISEAISNLEEIASQSLAQAQEAQTLYELGRLYYNRSILGKAKSPDPQADLNQARKQFEGALKINPNYANALYSLALVYERQGKIKEALKKLEKVVELNPDRGDVKKKVAELKGKVE